MSTATATRPVVLLRYALLLAGLLAVILGLLGMHVLAGSHGMHAQAASASGPSGQETTGQESGHPAGHGTNDATVRDSIQVPDAIGEAHAGPSATPASATIGGTEVPPSCVCQGGCAEKQAVHAGCTPSPAGASLSAPQPGSTFLDGESWTAARADGPAGYAYVPGTPSPRDLSISRT
jgi:hypothetical protein